MAGTAGPTPLDAALPEKMPTGRIDPLLIAMRPNRDFARASSVRPGVHDTSKVISAANVFFAEMDEVAGYVEFIGMRLWPRSISLRMPSQARSLGTSLQAAWPNRLSPSSRLVASLKRSFAELPSLLAHRHSA